MYYLPLLIDLASFCPTYYTAKIAWSSVNVQFAAAVQTWNHTFCNRSPHDSRQRSQKQRDPPQELQENGEEEEELDEEGEMMKKIMGFSHFDSTKVQRHCVRPDFHTAMKNWAGRGGWVLAVSNIGWWSFLIHSGDGQINLSLITPCPLIFLGEARSWELQCQCSQNLKTKTIQVRTTRLASILVLCYCSIPGFFHAIAIISMQVLLLCSNYAHFIIELKQLCTMLWHWHLSLLARHLCCRYRWSECYCPCAGHCFRHFSELSQLTPPYWFAATWWFVHMYLATIPA